MSMAYFDDLSDYVYYNSAFSRPGTKAVGWLGLGHEFPARPPEDSLLDLLWLYCSISVAQMRGWHDCEFCSRGGAPYAERNGQELLLGTSELRAFSRDGSIYAAPTLIYHYMAVHHYQPPDEFLQALCDGPKPPSPEYFCQLDKLRLEWNRTHVR
jgi:hypothetical protein